MITEMVWDLAVLMKRRKIMNNVTIIMEGLLRITIVLIVGSIIFRLLEIADRFFNKRNDNDEM